MVTTVFRVVVLAAVVFGATLPAGASSKTIASREGNAKEWGATLWTADELARFGGAPEVAGAGRSLLLARYSYFVSNYDVARRYPVWVAHVDRADSIHLYRGRKKGAWGRSDNEFMPDRQVVEKARQLGVQFASNESFTGANPPEIPVGERNAGKITRGHLASNAEMKSLGSQDEGLLSQAESFSLANVVPQMQRHNAPIWAKLEDNCIMWAAQFGGVSVISGPVYRLDAKAPAPGNCLLYTTGKDGVRLPIPTHLFKIVIGKIDGKMAVAGFLVPHRADLTMADLPGFQVPVRRIEQMTGVNFMPKWGSNDALETKVDERWLARLSAAVEPVELEPSLVLP